MTMAAGLCVALLAGCTQPAEESAQTEESLAGAYLGQTPPGEEPLLFAAGVISTGMSERDMAISPDGKEIVYSVTLGELWALVHVREVDGVWSKPEVVPFSGHHQDLEPFFTPDGNRLYFVSNRPLEGGAEAKEDYDIWYVDRDGESWGEPVNLGAPVNTDANEFYPAVTNDGTLYWTATYGEGSEDIHLARLVNGAYGERETLGEAVNTPGFEFNAYVSPDESILIFSSARRGDVGGGDLYISFRDEDGAWSAAQNMGPEINSKALDYCPFISADGEYFFFSSRRAHEKPYPEGGARVEDLMAFHLSPQNGLGDIYWVSATVIERLRLQGE